MAQGDNAGAAAARPSFSRGSSSFDAHHPLQTFLDNLTRSRDAMPNCGAAAFAFSPLNAMPKIALGKWEVLEDDGVLIFKSKDGVHRVMPTGTREQYYHALCSVLAHGEALALVPEWAATVFKRHYAVKKQHEEYIFSTDDVVTLPGARLRQLRGNVNKASKLCSVEFYTGDGGDAEYLALNAKWYRQNAGLKFRTYDKTSIDWLLNNWRKVKDAVPDVAMLGVRERATMQLISLNLGCVLSTGMWTAYTQRFDREAKVKAANTLGKLSLATVFSSLPEENNGTADTKTIRENKERLAIRRQPFFTVTK
jgi:hypothetical protein